MSLRSLYPALSPFATGELEVGDGHTLYYEQSGHPGGVPVTYLHGGPGAGATRTHARLFDPARCRIVLFDQRGVGMSRPSASDAAGIAANTTWQLVDDLARLADHLGLSRLVISGGSWGSTLALAFAARYPERVRALVLRGVTTFRQRELDWFFRDGAGRLFPDAHAAFLAPLPDEGRDDPVAAYRRLLFGPAGEARDRAVRAWRAWALRLGTLSAARELLGAPKPRSVSEHALAQARLECLYSAERAFLERDGYLLEQAPRLASIPLCIVQGRYDLVCPCETALALHYAWPGSELRLTHAGHGMFEAETVDALLRAHDAAVESKS